MPLSWKLKVKERLGAGSLGKVFAVEAWGPQFDPQHGWKSPVWWCGSVPRAWECRQPSQSPGSARNPVSKFRSMSNSERERWPANAHVHTVTPKIRKIALPKTASSSNQAVEYSHCSRKVLLWTTALPRSSTRFYHVLVFACSCVFHKISIVSSVSWRLFLSSLCSAVGISSLFLLQRSCYEHPVPAWTYTLFVSLKRKKGREFHV